MKQTPDQNAPKDPAEGRLCAQCKAYFPAAGGMNFLSEDQAQHRWICKQCRDRLEAMVRKLT